ncbi:hypothetical protein ACFL2A_00060 [Thermodesulfobacteriota bacterium]
MKSLPIAIIISVFFISGCAHNLKTAAPNGDKGSDRIKSVDISSYLKDRAALLQEDSARSFYNDIALTEKEQKVNDYLSKLKGEMNVRYEQRGFFPSAESFSRAKADLESSRLLEILKKMPKGGMLHTHAYAMGDMMWIVNEALRQQNCFVYWYEDGEKYIKGELGFFTPGTEPAGFVLVSDIKEAEPFFDHKLFGLLTLDEGDLKSLDIRDEYEKCLQRIEGFLSYSPVFKDYCQDAFNNMINDNVMYAEIRLLIREQYDLQGNTYSIEDVVSFLSQLRSDIKVIDPDFDYKIILSDSRLNDAAAIKSSLATAFSLRKKFPDFVIGYDIEGEEEAGYDNLFYVDALLDTKELEDKYGVDMPYYFHSGESLSSENKNLYDAYLLRSKRLGQAFNLYLFPKLLERFKEEKTAVEINLISSQILGYVDDLSLHPARGYSNRGVECVLSSDSMAIFAYNGLSFDYWEAFMAWDLDLRALKKFAKNSIEYSAMNSAEKSEAMNNWQLSWDSFIDAIKTD